MSLLILLINFGKFVTSIAGLKYLFTKSSGWKITNRNFQVINMTKGFLKYL